MQPYLFPYIGYFQLVNAVDEFIVYDNIKFTKKGWINRNRILVNGTDSYITFPLKKDSDYLDIRDRYLADIWPSERKEMLARITESYRKSPYFDFAFPIIEGSILFEEGHLFKFILNSLNSIKEYLGIRTPFRISSTISIDHTLRAEERVIAICKARNASIYLNPIGGIQLYGKDYFRAKGIDLQFLKTGDIKYSQFNYDFVPSLSIIDVMMFNAKEDIQGFLASSYTVV